MKHKTASAQTYRFIVQAVASVGAHSCVALFIPPLYLLTIFG
jgi:hypothetical protein